MAEDENTAVGMVSNICINWREKEILLVLNNDKEKPSGFWPSGIWGMPGGKIKDGEAVEKAALRELDRETNQEGRLTKYRIEILRIARKNFKEKYIHIFIVVKIVSDGKLKNHEDPEAIPRWIPFQAIFSGRIKVFPIYIIGLRMILEKMMEGKNPNQGKTDRNGIPIISEGPHGLMEILNELKNAFDERGRYILPFYRHR